MGAPDPLPTRAALRERLSAAGVHGAALDAALDGTALDRHRQRVARYVDAALDEVRRVRRLGRDHELRPGEGHGLAIAILVLEAFGLVDRRRGLVDELTKRHLRAFRYDCGPRVGPASGATHAACRGAVEFLWRADPPLDGELVIYVSPRAETEGTGADLPIDTGIVIAAPPLVPAILPVEDGAELAQPVGWLLSIALEGLRRAMGASPWYELGPERKPGPHESKPSPHVLDLVQLDGDAATWGVVVNAIDERAKRQPRATGFRYTPDRRSPTTEWAPGEREGVERFEAARPCRGCGAERRMHDDQPPHAHVETECEGFRA